MIACKDDKKEVSFIEFEKSSTTESAESLEPNSTENSDSSDESQPNKLGDLYLGMSNDELTAMMGEPVKGKIEVWDTDNKSHQTWKYESVGLEIDMVGEEGEQVIFVMAASGNSNLVTNKGIGIGSARDDVVSSYQDLILDEQENEIVSGTFDDAVVFEFDNDKVSGIYIGSAG